jgi:hypothetical protein
VRNVAILTRCFVLFVAGASLACGGGAKPDTIPDSPVTEPAVQPLDVAHEYEAVPVQGDSFTPEALERPGMPPVNVKRMPALAQQRTKVARAKGKAKPDDVHVLVTLLWQEAMKAELTGTEDDAAKAKVLFTEGRDLLQVLYDAAGQGAGDELTVHRLAAATLTLGDEPSAIALYSELLRRFPDSADATDYKTWLGFLLVRAHRSADAMPLTEGWDVAADATPAGAAYVVAWVAFRQGNDAGARAAIAAAAAKWRGPVGREALLNDVKLIMARAGGSVEEGRSALVSALPPDKPVFVTLHMYKFHEALMFAGRYREAADALESLMDGAVDSDRVTFRYNQADYEFRANNPGRSAERIREALAACAGWADCPEQTKNAIAERMALLARLYHTTYATTLDTNYADAAKALYGAYLELTGRSDANDVKGQLSNLEDYVANANQSTGRHGKEVMGIFIQARGEQPKACYERALGTQPELSGEVKVIIDIAPTGEVTGVVTEPAAGEEGLAAVGGCLQDRIRAWTFPARTVPGLTRLLFPYAFKPRA